MDKLTKKFYEAMKDVLPELILSDKDMKRYAVCRSKKQIPPFDLLIELVDYLPKDVALDVIVSKEQFINYGWEMDAYLYALKRFDTDETKMLRQARRREERLNKITEMEFLKEKKQNGK
nr:MAG TPA: hypothetical protein [Caudoviricetes sp.]